MTLLQTRCYCSFICSAATLHYCTHGGTAALLQHPRYAPTEDTLEEGGLDKEDMPAGWLEPLLEPLAFGDFCLQLLFQDPPPMNQEIAGSGILL